MIHFRIGSIFPGCFKQILGISCLLRAQGSRWHYTVDNLYDFAIGKHNKIDAPICGGGPGMLIRPDVIDKWLNSFDARQYHLIYMSPRGSTWKQADALSMSKLSNIAILCGRYEGVDMRVLEHWGFKEISIGDFILCGGEIAACAIIESVVRLVPGVLGNFNSLNHETHNTKHYVQHDKFTKPIVWQPINSSHPIHVPSVLLSGNHQNIRNWQENNRLKHCKTQ